MAYPSVNIGKIAKVKGGKRLPLGSDFSAEETDHPYIRARDIRNGTIRLEAPVYIDEEVFEKIKRYTVQANDVCIVIVGANVGDVGMVPLSLNGANLTENAVKLTELDGCDPYYLKYSLLTEEPQQEMKLFAGGAAQPKLGIYKVNDIKIRLPKLSEQRKIASILSAYDDLIENNNRRIKTLENMAQAIYKEWFVNFCFPEHKKIKLVKSKLGMIPEGWEVKTLGDVCHILMGQSPKSEFYNTAGEGLPFHQGVTDFGRRFPTHTTYCTVDNRIAEEGDILLSVRAPVGRINIANTKLVIGRGLSAVRHREDLQSYLYYQLKTIFTKEDSMGSGSIFKAVTKEDLHSIKLHMPNKGLDKSFDVLVAPIDSEIKTLSMKNDKLRKTRDLLLPKLISGEIDVKGLKIETEQ